MIDSYQYLFQKEGLIWYIPIVGMYDCNGVYHLT